MALPGKTNQSITLSEASKLTERFRRQVGVNIIKGGIFWKESIEKILDQPKCIALRFYYGLTENDEPTLVLVGVDTEGNDIENGPLAEFVLPCPPWCSKDNPLIA